MLLPSLWPGVLVADAPPPEDTPALGVYIHWPFCAAICPYCDFNVHPLRDMQAADWRKGYFLALEHARTLRADGPVETVFFGGGTPSLMPPELIADLLADIDRRWGLAAEAEISLEANPVSAPEARLQALKAAGINRLSLGVQAFDAGALKFLGRTHSQEQAEAAFVAARGIFDRASLDLIYARPEQTLAGWARELEYALALEPAHMSLYQLTIEPDTPFFKRHAAGKFDMPDEALAADMYELTQEKCAAAGLPAYEVSNHAREGHACRHNLASWRGGDYFGIGPGAHGRVRTGQGRVATEALAKPAAWLESLVGGGDGLSEKRLLQPEDLHAETVLLGLRLVEGVPMSRLEAAGVPLDRPRIAGLRDAGLIAESPHNLAVTQAGRLLLDRITDAVLAD